MNCPKCGRPMQPGSIYSWAQPVQWAPEGVKPSFWLDKLPRGGIFLREKKRAGLTRLHQAEAHYCMACNFVLAPTK